MPPEPPHRFDLTDDWARQRRADGRSTTPWAVAFLLFGLLLLLGALFAGGAESFRIILLLFGLLLTAFPITILVLGVFGPTRALSVSDAGIVVERARMRPATLSWSDPRLGLRITEFTADRATFFQPSQPQFTHPQWIYVSPPVREESTVPAELVAVVTDRARAHGVRVEQFPVLVFSASAGRDPSPSLTSRRVRADESTVPNGRLTLIGPAAYDPGETML